MKLNCDFYVEWAMGLGPSLLVVPKRDKYVKSMIRLNTEKNNKISRWPLYIWSTPVLLILNDYFIYYDMRGCLLSGAVAYPSTVVSSVRNNSINGLTCKNFPSMETQIEEVLISQGVYQVQAWFSLIHIC